MRDEDGDNNHHYENIFFHRNEILFASRYKGFYSYDRQSQNIKRIEPRNVQSVGEALACLAIDSTYYLVGSKGILTMKNGQFKHLTTFKEQISIHQIISNEHSIFLFTSRGNYHLFQSRATSFKKWLNIEVDNINDFKFGFFNDGKLTLLNDRGDRWLEIVLNSRGGFFSIKEEDGAFILGEDERIISFSFNSSSNVGAALTNKGHIYKAKPKDLDFIAHNYNEPLLEAKSILVDYNGDFWVCSDLKGLYKVSLEAFTKLQLIPLYEEPNIGFPYRTVYGDIIISLMSGETHLRNVVDPSINKTFDFIIHGMDEINGEYYVATNRGLKLFNPAESFDFNNISFDNENITFLMVDEKSLWVGVAGKGLHKINVSTNEIQRVESKTVRLPQYFYTGQVSNNGKSIYFGTNTGIFKLEKSSGIFSRVKTGPDLGSYSGVSTKDIYGNCWFTLEKGIVGITTKEKIKVIDGNKYLRTNLFYTLNSDNYGNLIVGTNKGINLVKVDKNGDVKDYRHFDGDSGFDGYETHMRSQFKGEDGIFVGTVEGLFLINTRIIENLKSPLSPVIKKFDSESELKDERNSFTFNFSVNNAKAGKIRYSYRLKGETDEWTTLEDGNSVSFYDLSNGSYTLEVRSSFDGIHFSDSSFYDFTVSLPLWKTNWFIILILLIIIGINIFLVIYNKSFNTSKLLDTKDTTVHLRMTPALLMFGTVAVTGAHILAPLLNPQLELHLGTSLIVGFILLTLFLLSLSARQTNKIQMFSMYLITGVIVICIQFLYELYMTGLHPFHLTGLILTTTVVPYILGRIKSTIIFSLGFVAMAMICMLLVKDPIYPKAYYLIAIIVNVALLIFTSFLRYDSVEKLMFISGIINKGNIPALAFSNDGTLRYVSENIANFIDSSHEELVNKNISVLNNHIPFEGEFRSVDVLQEFKDGETYVVPMADKDKNVRWIEWSYKDFSQDVKVMLGQDISDKMELENTYELLVQNAEDFIYRCDINGNFLFLNDVCFKKLGYEKEDLLEKSSLSIIADSHVKDIDEYYKDHFAKKKLSSYKEFPIKKKDGNIIWIGQYVTTLYAAGSDSYINGYIALARDITADREKRQLIREQRDDITASINYAQRIQFNLLPHERLFNSYFKEHFIIYKPKDIVSGDFYWMEKIENKVIVALADCTGHGVPGSFMTLLGINLLNSIVHEEQISDPGQILNELDKRLIEILPRGKGKNKVNDGMEITVCVIDDSTNEMAFACAGSRFLIYSNEEFTMFKGDNKHIGDVNVNGFTTYSTNFAELNPNDQLYLFTDGFQDQFGGPNDKKYSFRRMLELFEGNKEESLYEQQTVIEEAFDSWIGQGDQTDDLSVISIVRNLI
jgi:PAS domain S-box-containing protein